MKVGDRRHELISHPDCLGTALRLGLPVPEDVIEAMCYRPPVAQPSSSLPQSLRSSSSSSRRRVRWRQGLAQWGAMMHAAGGGGGLPARPTSLLPNRQPGSIPSKKKVRVVTGVANQRPVAPASAGGGSVVVGLGSGSAVSVLNQGSYVPPPSFSSQLRGGTGRTTSATRATGGPSGVLAPPPPSSAALPRPPRTAGAEVIRAVRQLPKYSGGDDSSDEEKNHLANAHNKSASNKKTRSPPPAATTAGGGGASPLMSVKQPGNAEQQQLAGSSSEQRKLYSYEKRIQSVERLQRLKEEAEEQAYTKYQMQMEGSSSQRSGGLTEDSYRRYMAHVHEDTNADWKVRGVSASSGNGGFAPELIRPATASTDQTLLMLNRHDLLPAGWEAEAQEEALRRSREIIKTTITTITYRCRLPMEWLCMRRQRKPGTCRLRTIPRSDSLSMRPAAAMPRR